MRDQARLDGKCEKGAKREQTFLARCSHSVAMGSKRPFATGAGTASALGLPG